VSKREMPEEEPLNLVPIMNLVTILIPVLLMAIKSMELAVIDTTLPAIGSPSESTEDVPDKKPLELKLAITYKGIKILGADPYLYPGGRPAAAEGEAAPPDVACGSNDRCRGMEDYKWSDLADKLTKIKKGAKDDDRDSENVVLIPEANIKYEILVKAMDITRKNGDTSLFPKVSFAGGTNAN